MAVLVSVNSTVFFLNRTLIPLAPAHGVLEPAPYGYHDPIPKTLFALDPAGSFNVSYGFDAYAVYALKEGCFPFWNPYQGLGQPFHANGLSAVLYPLNWLHLLLPPAWWDLVYLLNWFLAALFLYAYLRRVGLDRLLALFAGAAVLTSGYFQCYLALREVPGTAAWFPLLLYAVERTFQEPRWSGRHWVLALGIFCTITAGQPEVAFVSLFVVLVFALIRLLFQKEGRGKILLALVPGSLAGLLLAAPMWLNFAAYAFTAYSLHLPEDKVGLAHFGYHTLTANIFPYFYGILQTYPVGRFPGWDWDSAQGWLPALTVFPALASLGGIFKKPDKTIIFLAILALLTAAKICGAPGVNYLGALPLFDRLNFMRYAAFLLTFSLAGLAAYGLRYLGELPPPRWKPWLLGWTALALILFLVGIHAVWPNLRGVGLGGAAARKVLIFVFLGLGWGLLCPWALWRLRQARPQDTNYFYIFAGFGILLQGAAYNPSGFTYEIYTIMSLAYLATYLLSIFVFIRLNIMVSYNKLVLFGLAAAMSFPLAISLITDQGLPARCDPLQRPPYINHLVNLQDNGRFRSYSFDSTPAPNFAAPFGISSLGVNEALVTKESAHFLKNYLDRGASPIWLAANTSGFREHGHASQELQANLRYFSLVGVKFVLGQKTEPFIMPFFDTEALGQAWESFPLRRPLEMTWVCPEDELDRVDILLYTYRLGRPGERLHAGKVRLNIFGPDRAILRTVVVDSSALSYRGYQEFVFPPLTGLRGREMRLELSFLPLTPDAMIAAFNYPKAPHLGFVCQMFSAAGTPQTYPLVYRDPETGVRIWENPQAAPRLFLAPEVRVVASGAEALARLKETPDLTRQVWLTQGPALASSWPPERPPGQLREFRLSPNEVQASFEAHTPGILTLTDSYSPGWRATLNGQEVPVLLVDGVFRGLRLENPGAYEVRFWYRPPYWNISLGLAGLGMLLILGGNLVGPQARGKIRQR